MVDITFSSNLTSGIPDKSQAFKSALAANFNMPIIFIKSWTETLKVICFSSMVSACVHSSQTVSILTECSISRLNLECCHTNAVKKSTGF